MKVLEFIVVCLGILISASAKKAKKTKEVVQKTNESITPWEYCEGCKISVDLFSNRATKRLAEMQSNHVKSGEVFNADSVVQGMCDAEELTANYIPAMKWSCVKITSDNLTAFLNPWLGSASAADSSAKGGVFEKKREVWMTQHLVSIIIVY